MDGARGLELQFLRYTEVKIGTKVGNWFSEYDNFQRWNEILSLNNQMAALKVKNKKLRDRYNFQESFNKR